MHGRVKITDWRGVPVLVTGGAGFIGRHLVQALIDAGAALSGGASAPPLSRAAQRGHLKMVRLLLRRGADSSAAEPSMHGATALYLAAQGGFEAVAAVVRQRGGELGLGARPAVARLLARARKVDGARAQRVELVERRRDALVGE